MNTNERTPGTSTDPCLHDDLVKALEAARDHICDKMAAHKTDPSELVDMIDSVLERARQNLRNQP